MVVNMRFYYIHSTCIRRHFSFLPEYILLYFTLWNLQFLNLCSLSEARQQYCAFPGSNPPSQQLSQVCLGRSGFEPGTVALQSGGLSLEPPRLLHIFQPAPALFRTLEVTPGTGHGGVPTKGYICLITHTWGGQVTSLFSTTVQTLSEADSCQVQ